MRTQSPATGSSVATPASSVTTQRIRPRAMRSPRSAAVSSVEAGLTTAPSFMAASVISQSGVVFGSITRMRSPRDSPARRRNDAAREDRSDSSANVERSGGPASGATHRASRPLPRASTSK